MKEPSLQGLTDIKDLRNLLRDWVNSFPHEPEIEDVATMTDFFIELVRARDLEKPRLLIIYLNYLIKENPYWIEHVEKIKQMTSNVVISMYGYPLQF